MLGDDDGEFIHGRCAVVVKAHPAPAIRVLQHERHPLADGAAADMDDGSRLLEAVVATELSIASDYSACIRPPDDALRVGPSNASGKVLRR